MNNRRCVGRLKLDVKELSEKCEAVILAHNYQLPEIQEVADYVGDSLELAKIAVNIDSELILFAVVSFMIDEVKIGK